MQASSNLSRYLLVVIILTLGGVLRTSSLAHQSFWSDELFSVGMATALPNPQGFWHFERKLVFDLTLSDSFWTWKGADQSPPLFELVLLAWSKIAGSSELAMRLPSAAASTLALVLTSVALWRVLPSRMLILYLLLFALSWPAILYAREARVYALATLFSAITSVHFARAVVTSRRGGTFRLTWSLVVALTCLSLSHHYGLVLAGLLSCIAMLYSWRFGHKRDVYRFTLIPIFLLPWFWLNGHALRFAANGHIGWKSYALSSLFTSTLPEIFRFFFPGHAAIVVAIALVIGIPMAVKGWLRPIFTTSQERLTQRAIVELALIFSALIVVMIAVAICIARRSGNFHPRHLIIVLPWLSFVLAFLLHVSCSVRTIPAILSGALIACLVISSVFEQSKIIAPKEQYREASAFIASRIQKNDVVVGAWPTNLLYYSVYLRRFIPSAVSYRLEPMKGIEDAERIAQLLCGKAARPSQIFLFGHASHKPWIQAAAERCSAAFPVQEQKDFNSLHIQILRRLPSSFPDDAALRFSDASRRH